MSVKHAADRLLRYYKMEILMDRKKVFLIMQSALWILLAVSLIAAVIGIYREGAAAKADDVLAWTYSRDTIAESFRMIRPLFYITIGVSAVGLILGVKDENGLKPVKGGKVQNQASCARERILRVILLIAAVCLLAAGLFNGSARDVLGKAVNVCTECIGLG